MTAKKKPRKGTKQPPSIVKNSWFVSAMICLALLLPFAGYRYYLYRQGAPLRKVMPQMQAIQQELSAKLPNVTHNELTKYCGKSSDVQDNGTVSCSIRLYVILPSTDRSKLDALHPALKKIFDDHHIPISIQDFRQHTYYSESVQSVTLKDSLTCSLYERLYASSTDYEATRLDKSTYTFPLYNLDLYCTDYPSVILPGYPRIH